MSATTSGTRAVPGRRPTSPALWTTPTSSLVRGGKGEGGTDSGGGRGGGGTDRVA